MLSLISLQCESLFVRVVLRVVWGNISIRIIEQKFNFLFSLSKFSYSKWVLPTLNNNYANTSPMYICSFWPPYWPPLPLVLLFMIQFISYVACGHVNCTSLHFCDCNCVRICPSIYRLIWKKRVSTYVHVSICLTLCQFVYYCCCCCCIFFFLFFFFFLF